MIFSEGPLVIFTVFSQLGVGVICWLWWWERKQIEDKEGFLALQYSGRIWALALTVVGLLVSLLHLGHPFMAFRALSHLSSSWLSREVLLFGIFFLLLIIQIIQWSTNSNSDSWRHSYSLATVIVGLLAVISSGMAYVLPARPAWNNLSPLVLFFLTTFVGGGFLAALLADSKGVISEVKKYRLLLLLVIVTMVINIFYFSLLSSAGGTSLETLQGLMGHPFFWLRIIVGFIAPLVILGWRISKGRKISLVVSGSVFILVVLGELLGRTMFYDTVVALHVVNS